MFEKFHSLTRPHSSKKSTGLGLAFVREIAQLHDGRVELNNVAASGALAAFTLPQGAGLLKKVHEGRLPTIYRKS